jgi:ABC-type uncharacterized transport system permease subunit
VTDRAEMPPWSEALRALRPALIVVAAILAALTLFVLLAGSDPFAAAGVFLGASLGSWDGFLEGIVRAIPISIAGIGMCVAFRARLFNVGADGQFIVGAITSVAVALAFPGLSPWLLLPLFLLAAMVGGGLWGGLAGWLRARVNANEIIVTIMLNYVAIQLLAWVIRGPMQESMKIFPRTNAIPDGLVFAPLIDGSRVHAGLLIALAVAGLVLFIFARTRFGFRLRAVGESREAARYGGTDDKAMIVLAMLVSGALAGLAGAVEIAGIHGRLQDGFSGGVGITAIAAALLARLNPVGVLAAALLFGLMSVGTGALQRDLNIPFPLVSIIEGIVIFGFLATEYLQRRNRLTRQARHG